MFNMLRLRRHRLVLVFAAIFMLAAYHFSLLSGENSLFSVQKPPIHQAPVPGDKHSPDDHAPIQAPEVPKPPQAEEGGEEEKGEGNKKPHVHEPPPPVTKETIAVEPQETSTSITTTKFRGSTLSSSPTLVVILQTTLSAEDDLLTGFDELVKPPPPRPVYSKPHWFKPSERFPVPTESLIKLPSPRPESVPRIQATFPKENAKAKEARLKRREAVKDAMRHSWKGYKQYAWGHDEVTPVTRYHRQKFGGWGATLVDSLDTLWIMGMVEEFEEALQFVEKLDFTSSTDPMIPVFETTIRYLGGLLGAYDVSERKYPILLKKAVELGDVLYGVFDTPNRMPILFYAWQPESVAIPSLAPWKSGLAEMGTLALEFTHLAQLSGNHSYFDAVQRITDGLEAIQYNTTIPGMWPTFVDASGGCMPVTHEKSQDNIGWLDNEIMKRQTGGGNKKKPFEDQKGPGREKPKPIDNEPEDKPTTKIDTAHTTTRATSPPAIPQCTPLGVQPLSELLNDEYTLGAAADSFYEYLVKMHLLLEAGTDQYSRMYKSSMEHAKSLFFRPMLPQDPDILISGNLHVTGPRNTRYFRSDTGHLACFTGGMLALGSRAMNLKDDLEIGRKLTDGCVWLYGLTKSGVMPEVLSLVKCDDVTSCEWQQQVWLDQVLPGRSSYGFPPKPQLPADGLTPPSQPTDLPGGFGVEPIENNKDLGQLRPEIQLPEGQPGTHKQGKQGKQGKPEEKKSTITKPESQVVRPPEEQPLPNMRRSNLAQDSFNKKPARREYLETAPTEMVWEVIHDQRLPEGIVSIGDPRYMLRPEAIESVFVMYRVTADPKWQDKGWQMFQSTAKVTKTQIAYAEVSDVTRDPADSFFIQNDSMESFWLAETLKYYYLLFSEPELISLDEWVLNTEAHPFKRTKK